MSCILYSKASYTALAKHPIFDSIEREIRAYKDDERDTATLLYETNVEAFTYRYRGDYPEDVAAAEAEPIDYEFADALKAGTVQAIWHLLHRIDYQFCEGENYDKRKGYIYLQRLEYKTANRMASELDRIRNIELRKGGLLQLAAD